MKRLVVAAMMAVLVVAGSVFAQALSAYERRFVELMINFFRETTQDMPAHDTPSVNRRNNMFAQIRRLENLPNDREKRREVVFQYQEFFPAAQMAANNGIINATAFQARVERLGRDLTAARSLMTPVERQLMQEQEEGQRREEQERARIAAEQRAEQVRILLLPSMCSETFIVALDTVRSWSRNVRIDANTFRLSPDSLRQLIQTESSEYDNQHRALATLASFGSMYRSYVIESFNSFVRTGGFPRTRETANTIIIGTMIRDESCLIEFRIPLQRFLEEEFTNHFGNL